MKRHNVTLQLQGRNNDTIGSNNEVVSWALEHETFGNRGVAKRGGSTYKESEACQETGVQWRRHTCTGRDAIWITSLSN